MLICIIIFLHTVLLSKAINITSKEGRRMSSSNTNTTSGDKEKLVQVVFVPSPGMSHLVSTIEFAKHLINRHPLLSVTLFHINTPSDDSHSAPPIPSQQQPRLHLITLPPPPPTGSDSDSASNNNNNKNPTSPGHVMASLLEAQKPNLRDAVSNLSSSSSRVGAFVVDMFCITMIDVAREFGVPAFLYFTSGVAFLSFIFHIHTLRERDNFHASDLKDTPHAELLIPGYSNPVPASVLPTVVTNKEWDHFFLSYAQGIKTADGFLVNSFQELESHAVHSFHSHHPHIPMYPVGPILNVHDDNDNDNNDVINNIMTWLDHQPPSSVIFLCFGSMGSMDHEQAREIALALEASETRFLWSLRKPTLKAPAGFGAPPSDYTVQELGEVLPEGFLDRTAGIGRVIGWAPQAQILAHKATAGFVSHCGWNSTLESVYYGVPIATWPLYAEQQMNAFQLTRELNIAVEIALDYRVEEGNAGRNKLLSADTIERGIKELLGKDEGGRGEIIRKKVKEISDKCRKTLTEEGGSSYSHLGRFIDFIIN